MKITTHPLADAAVTANLSRVGTDLKLAARLRTSLATLTTDPDALASRFYAKLFDRFPQLRAMFPADMTVQRGKLMQTLDWVIGNLDRPSEIRPAVAALGQRHVGYGAKPEHYPPVRDALVDAMAEIAGKDWSRDLDADWRQAIDLLAEMMLRG